jgi:hypothetical protein
MSGCAVEPAERRSSQNHTSRDLENAILLKYKDGDLLDLSDNQYIIYELKTTGLLRCGFDLEYRKETVRTTARGVGLLKLRGIV